MALVFGKYEKIRRIAQGGMGEVFLARQTGVLDRLAILKALRTDLGKEREFVDQFLDEARVAATLNHPNIVAIYDVGEWHNTHYIAMEYIAGEDLSKLWYAAAKAGVGLPFQVSVRIIMEAALGLDHAHRAKDVRGKPLNIVHRDISPQNIMVRADGVTKLVDFGIAKAANKASRTQAGMVKGKLQYMSPEQVRGEPLDGRSDQFSLGIVLWEMCTGRRLFKADNEINTLQKILQNPIPKPTQHVPGFPAELEAVIMKMLERDINRRFAHLGDVAQKLKEYLDRSSVSAGEVSVAAFVQQILGKELDARIADLTPMEATEAGAPLPEPNKPAPPPKSTTPAAKPKPAPAPVAAKQTLVDDDKDPPTQVLAPEDRDQRPPTEDGLAALSDGPTGEWVVRRADGSMVHFQAWATVQQWVLDGKLHRDDAISTDGRRFVALGDEPQLFDFFATADAARKGARPAPTAPTVPEGRQNPLLAMESLATTEEGPTVSSPVIPARLKPVPAPPSSTTKPAPPPAQKPAPPPAPAAATTKPVPAQPENLLEAAPSSGGLDPFEQAPTGAFSLGALPSQMTGAWQLGNDFQALAAAAAAANQGPSASTSPTPAATGQAAIATEPARAPAPATTRQVPMALWGLLGIVGAVVVIGLVLRVAVPDALSSIVGGTERSSARAQAAITAIATDEPATVAALRATLEPLLAEAPDGDVLVAATLLSAEQARVEATAAALFTRQAKEAPPGEARAAIDALVPRLRAVTPPDAWTRYAITVADVVAGSDATTLVAPPDAPPALAQDAAAAAMAWRVTRALPTGTPTELQGMVGSGDDGDRRLVGLRGLVAAIAADTDDARAAARRALLTRQQKAPSDPRLGAALALLDGPTSKQPDPKQPKQPEPKQPEPKQPEPKQPDVAAPPPPPAPEPTPAPPPPPPPEPETYETALAKGVKAQKSGKSKEAVRLLTIALELKPGDPAALLSLGWAQLDRGSHESAIKSFRSALKGNGALVEAQFGVGEALRAAGRTTEAVEAFQKYLELAPSGPDAETAKNAIRALE